MSREGQCPRHPSTPLIPRARGGRARCTVYLLLSLCVTALCLAGLSPLPTARTLLSHFVTLHVGVLLKAICHLAEEIFHIHSRYHGSFQRVLSACFPLPWHGLVLLSCGSAYVALLDGDGQPLSLHLGLASLCHLLSLALGLDKPSAVEVSELAERSQQNVAHGLAWSYYVGYLKIVLPRVKKSLEEFSRANPNVLTYKETWKLHILVPLSCEVYDDLEKADSNIQYLTDLPEITLTRAGIKKRVYRHSLYTIRDEDKMGPCTLGGGNTLVLLLLPWIGVWLCAVEFATSLQSLYAMSQEEGAAFSREQRLEQTKLFYRSLEEILRGSKECAGTYRLIAYEESGEAESHFLSREILWHLRQERDEEYDVSEGREQHSPSTTFSSAELNLQLSVSDRPQPLRSDRF